MIYINAYLLVILISLLVIPFLSSKWKADAALLFVILLACISSIPTVKALSHSSTILVPDGSIVTGKIPVIIDPLAAWFILTINFTFITAAIYGKGYLRAYSNEKSK